MNILIAATLVASWSYGDFVADPVKPSPNARQGVAPAPPAAPDATVHPAIAPTPKAESKTPATAAVLAPALAPTSLWRLADSNGQVWVHADPDWLSRWVAQRNAQIEGRPGGARDGPAGSWNCTPSGCYRAD